MALEMESFLEKCLGALFKKDNLPMLIKQIAWNLNLKYFSVITLE